MTRLIDLSAPWLLQYAADSTVFAPEHYREISGRLGQLDGYLQTTAAAFVPCSRADSEWSTLADPWPALNALVARVEAEFSGRLLIGLDDFGRWKSDPTAMSWALLAIERLDRLVRNEGRPRPGRPARRSRCANLHAPERSRLGPARPDRRPRVTFPGPPDPRPHRTRPAGLFRNARRDRTASRSVRADPPSERKS